MLKWLSRNWQILILHAVAIGALSALSIQTIDYNIYAGGVFDPAFGNSGRWAIRLLLLSLAITPLNTYLGWRWAIKLRKWAGLWAFTFALIHVYVYVSDSYPLFVDLLGRLEIAFGMIGLAILAALALTSTTWAMRRLGKNWKRLHRLVYAAGVLVTLHAILAYANSKKAILSETFPRTELNLYLAIMLLLLALRLPFVKQSFQMAKKAVRMRTVQES